MKERREGMSYIHILSRVFFTDIVNCTIYGIIYIYVILTK
jgi:hypothetical protein